jgi:hypothetical protein
MDRIHDAASASSVLAIAALLGLLATAAIIARRPSVLRLLGAIAIGLLITAASAFAVSTDWSGTARRTRRGLPHSFTIANVDPETGVVITPARIVPEYLLCDAAAWCAAALLAAALSARPARPVVGARR